jgi:hypothetical protein
MKSIIKGVLRIIISLSTSIYIFKVTDFEAISPGFEDAEKSALTVGSYIALSLVFIFVLYMLLNGIREIRNLTITYKPLYFVVILTLTFYLIATIPGYLTTENYWDIRIIIFELLNLLIFYFFIADFMTFFFKRKKE